MLTEVQPPFDYVVVLPGVILSQHQLSQHKQLKDALRAREKAISKGFPAVVLERTSVGWKECWKDS